MYWMYRHFEKTKPANSQGNLEHCGRTHHTIYSLHKIIKAHPQIEENVYSLLSVHYI